MKRRLPFQAAAVLAFCVTSLSAGAAPALADTIATIDVNASFVPGDAAAAFFPSTGPTLFVTGQFTFDEDTLAFSSWNMGFLGPLGATYQLSPQDGGVATARCSFSPTCPVPTGSLSPSSWIFSFSNSNASVSMVTLRGTGVAFEPGEILAMCPAALTIYPGPVFLSGFPCDLNGEASFDGQTGVPYQLPNGFSGTLTVTSLVSTPEPAESTLLLLGLAILVACAPRRLQLPASSL
jgi:hypothetical protein